MLAGAVGPPGASRCCPGADPGADFALDMEQAACQRCLNGARTWQLVLEPIPLAGLCNSSSQAQQNRPGYGCMCTLPKHELMQQQCSGEAVGTFIAYAHLSGGASRSRAHTNSTSTRQKRTLLLG